MNTLLSESMKDYKDILEFLIGSTTIPEELKDEQTNKQYDKEAITGREHLMKYLNFKLLRDIKDKERIKMVGNDTVSHYLANIHLDAAVKMKDPIALLIKANRKANGLNGEKSCKEAVEQYVEALRKDQWYDSEFEFKSVFPGFQPITYAYAYMNVDSFMGKMLKLLNTPLDKLIKYSDSHSDLVNVGKFLYRLGYKGKEIYDLFMKAYDLGNVDGLVLAGIITELGVGVEKNLTKAAEYYFKAENNSIAASRIGLLFDRYDSPIGYSLDEMNQRLIDGAELGHTDAYYHLLRLSESKSYVKNKNQNKLEMYKINLFSKDSSHGHGMYFVGKSFLNPNSTVDCANAISLLQTDLFKINIQMQILNELAERYYNLEMYHPALMIYQFLSELGFVNAQLNAAFLLESGKGCSKVSRELRIKKAMDLYKSTFLTETESYVWKMLMKNIPGLKGTAASRIGDIYFNGLLYGRDIHKALEWYRIAEEDSHPNALFKLGLISQYTVLNNKNFKLKEPDYYYQALMNMSGYYNLGYLMHLNLVFEEKVSIFFPYAICITILILIAYQLNKYMKKEENVNVEMDNTQNGDIQNDNIQNDDIQNDNTQNDNVQN